MKIFNPRNNFSPIFLMAANYHSANAKELFSMGGQIVAGLQCKKLIVQAALTLPIFSHSETCAAMRRSLSTRADTRNFAQRGTRAPDAAS